LRILSVLQTELNLPFRDAYAKRVRKVEIFELHASLDRAEPFPMRPSGNNLVGPETLEDPAQSKNVPICRSSMRRQASPPAPSQNFVDFLKAKRVPFKLAA
jgi:hypothetical protein